MEVPASECKKCRRLTVQHFIAILPSGFYLNLRCEDHLVEPGPRVVEITPVQALFITMTVGIA